VLIAGIAGCGTTREKLATEQLLLSDAVDRSVADLDFSPLANERVFLDTQYIQFDSKGLVNSNYVSSAIRQQMAADGCLLQESAEGADYVVEARVGTLGSDGHDINYGVPPSNAVNTAATLVANTPPLPVLPEISLARKTQDTAAAKIAVFAYHRESRRPVWQSGTKLARSVAQARWFFGAGPFQSGSIYRKPQFAGESLGKISSLASRNEVHDDSLDSRDTRFRSADIWDAGLRRKVESGEHLLPPEATGGEAVAQRPAAPSDNPDQAVETAEQPQVDQLPHR
jgi:hypothetical protein